MYTLKYGKSNKDADKHAFTDHLLDFKKRGM